MKALWLTPSMPHPQGAGGSAHEFELLRGQVERGNELRVVTCHYDSNLGPGELERLGVPVTAVRYDQRPHPTSKLGVARELARADPSVAIWLARARIPAMARAVAELTDGWKPDVVQVTHGELAGLLPRAPGPTALLLFDAMTRALRTRLAFEPLPRRRAQLRIEAQRTERFERRRYRHATGVASVSDVDAAWLERAVGRQIVVLPNPIAEQFFEPASVARRADDVVFVGALTHHPNVDAIRWLATEIWPLVLARRPSARLRVVGRGDGDPTVDELRRVVELAGGSLDADVADIRPWYWGAAAVVAPLRQGSGLRNKVLHAMATGTPVVATPPALEGVPSEAARHARSATTAIEVADAVADVLANPEAAATSAAHAVDALGELRTAAIARLHEAWWDTCAS